MKYILILLLASCATKRPKPYKLDLTDVVCIDTVLGENNTYYLKQGTIKATEWRGDTLIAYYKSLGKTGPKVIRYPNGGYSIGGGAMSVPAGKEIRFYDAHVSTLIGDPVVEHSEIKAGPPLSEYYCMPAPDTAGSDPRKALDIQDYGIPDPYAHDHIWTRVEQDTIGYALPFGGGYRDSLGKYYIESYEIVCVRCYEQKKQVLHFYPLPTITLEAPIDVNRFNARDCFPGIDSLLKEGTP